MSRALDLARLKRERQLTLFEDFSQPTQLRALRWIHSLTRKQLETLLHKSGEDAAAVKTQWHRFLCEKRSSLRGNDLPEDGVRYTRVYSPPASGAPGRLLCTGSLQDLPRVFRNLLIQDVCSDMDIKCAGATILCWLCYKYKLDHGAIRSYARDRDRWHRDANMDSGLSHRACKQLVIVAMYAKTPPKTKSRTLRPLLEQIHAVKTALYKEHELQWAHQHANVDNVLGSFLSHIVCAIEAAIVNECMRFAQREYGWKICALVHDGFNPVGKFDRAHHRAELEAFARVAEELCPGIEMRFEWKAFDLGVYDKKTGELLRTVEVPEDWTEPLGGVDEEDLFEGDAQFQPCYEVVKREFEELVFKVSDNYVDLETLRDGKMSIITRKVLMDRFEERCYSVCDRFEERRNVPFLPAWMRDPKIRKYRRFVMEPTGTHDAHEYNMWSGYAVDRIKEHDAALGKEHVLFYLTFLKHLLPTKRDVLFLLDWKAHFHQLPGEKPGIMACLLGEQGGGKSTVLEAHALMIGEELTMTTQYPENDVYGHNGTICIANKKFLNLQECSREQLKQHINGLKPVVTDRVLRVKGMGKDPIPIDSTHGVALSSNSLDAPPDSDKERRFWAVLCTTHWATCWETKEEKVAYFERLNEVIRDSHFQAHFKEFLKRREGVPKRFQIENVPMGELQRTLRANNKEWIEQFLRHLVDRPTLLGTDGEISMTVPELQSELDAFVAAQGWQFTKSERALTTKLSFLKLTWKGVRGGGEEHRVWRKHVGNVNLWHFDLDVLRPRFGIDIAKDRARKRLGEELAALANKPQQVKSAPHTLLFGPREKKVALDVLAHENAMLMDELRALAALSTATHVEEDDEFDPLAEYEKVMERRSKPSKATSTTEHEQRIT